ncbi:MAG: hypothetical protein AB7T06_34740 [Kofleriaceae bacterium]
MKSLLVAVVVVGACGGDEKPKNAAMCAPFTELQLPSITRLDWCTSTELTGETTASPEEFAKAFEAAGYEAGRDAQDMNIAKDHMWFRRGDVAFSMSARFEGSPARKNPYFSIRRDTPKKWLPESAWQAHESTPAAKRKMVAALRVAGELFTADAKAPKKCPSLAELDPMLATAARSVIVNLEGRYFQGDKGRGPDLFDGDLTFASMEEASKEGEYFEQVGARRIVPVARITSYDAPVATDSGVRAGEFKPGSAAFDVGVVDLVEKKILCRSSATAESSGTIRGVTTTYKNADGSTQSSSAGADADGDLGRNMRAAAFAELATMSPVFAAK